MSGQIGAVASQATLVLIPLRGAVMLREASGAVIVPRHPSWEICQRCQRLRSPDLPR